MLWVFYDRKLYVWDDHTWIRVRFWHRLRLWLTGEYL